MVLFNYKAFDKDGSERAGTVDAVNIDVAIAALQRRDLVISSIDPAETSSGFSGGAHLFERITNRDVVMLSRQMTTLFEAQVSALRAFQLLASEARTPKLAARLSAIASDIESGTTISAALSRHPDVFSSFYVNMVRAGEEAGKLDETFAFLADYLDRNYEITQKATNALIYPAFIMLTFASVMVLMMTLVIPKLSAILTETGQALPVYTRVVMAMSGAITTYIVPLIVLLVIAVIFLVRYGKTERGMAVFSHAKMSMPAVGGLYRKLYLSRIADNLSTMLRSGIQMLRALEITATVVGDVTYERIMGAVASDVKGGLSASDAMRKYPEVPGIFVAMVKIGEETGNLSAILETLARYYRREVNNTLDTVVGLIEPFMIVSLAIGVAFLLAAVLMPIYNVASGL